MASFLITVGDLKSPSEQKFRTSPSRSQRSDKQPFTQYSEWVFMLWNVMFSLKGRQRIPGSSWRVHWFFKFLRVLDWDFLGNSDSERSGWVPGIPVFKKPPRWFQWWPLFGNECCQPQILWTALECPRPLMMPYVFWTLWAPFHPFDGSCPLQNNKYW